MGVLRKGGAWTESNYKSPKTLAIAKSFIAFPSVPSPSSYTLLLFESYQLSQRGKADLGYTQGTGCPRGRNKIQTPEPSGNHQEKTKYFDRVKDVYKVVK